MLRVVTVLLGSLFLGSVAWGYPLQPPASPAAPKTSFEVRREVEYGGPVLGVMATELTPELQEFFGAPDLGVLVSRVYDDTAAADAGIEVGDVIVSVDDEPISTIWELRAAVDRAAGNDVIVEIIRQGELIALEAGLADMAPAWQMPEVPEVYVFDQEELDSQLRQFDSDFEHYAREFEEQHEEQWRARNDDARIERLERHLLEMNDKMISEMSEIHDRLEALEENDFRRPEVK